MEVFQGRVVVLVGEHPLLPVLRHAGDRQIASRLPCEVVEIVLIIGVQDLPRDTLERTGGGNRALADRVEQKLGKIGTRIFREDPRRAAREILRDDGDGVTAAAVEPIEFAAVGAEFDGACRYRVLCADPAEQHPLAVGATLQILDTAVIGVAHCEAHPEPLIGEMVVECLVRLQQRTFPGRNIDPVDVEVTLVPRVVPDQQFAGKMARVLLNVAGYPRSRRQRPYIAGFQINTPGTPIFVAGRLAEEYDMSVVPHPDDPRPEIAVGRRRHRARFVDPVDRGNPEIEHAVDRRAKRDLCAVVTDPHDASLGISKNQATGK
jgi:hypothetical protein